MRGGAGGLQSGPEIFNPPGFILLTDFPLTVFIANPPPPPCPIKGPDCPDICLIPPVITGPVETLVVDLQPACEVGLEDYKVVVDFRQVCEVEQEISIV
jgi:hypothetical protein